MTKKRKIIYITIAAAIVIIAALAIIFMPKTAPQTVTEMLSMAQKYLVEMDYERAIAEFNKVIELDPMNADAYLGLAEAYEKSGDIDKAVETLEKGFELTGDERIEAALAALRSENEETSETEAAVEETETEETPMPEVDIPSDAFEYNGHSYYVFSDICETWEDAEKYCESLGGYLAVINNDDENTAVYDIMKQQGYESAYFGYTDVEEDGNWHWIDGKSSSYTNWNRYEPSDGFYAMFYWKWEYTWNDGTFDDKTDNGGMAFICEWDEVGENAEISENEETVIFSADDPYTLIKHACNIISMFGTQNYYDANGIFYIGDPIEHGRYRVKNQLSDEDEYVYFKNMSFDNDSAIKFVKNQRVYVRDRLFDVDVANKAFTAYIADKKVKYNNYYLAYPSVSDCVITSAPNTFFESEEEGIFHFEAGGAPGIDMDITVIDNKITEINIPEMYWFSDFHLRYYYDENEGSWLLSCEYPENVIERMNNNEDYREANANDLPNYTLPYEKCVIYPTQFEYSADFDPTVFDIPENSSGYSSYENWGEYIGREIY